MSDFSSNKPGRLNASHRSHYGSAAPRILELDGLRGLACITVLVYHIRPVIVPYGWAAVDLFFVLSGYLITAILIRHEGSPGLLRNFYARRSLRIWPVYYLTIVALVIVGPWLPTPPVWGVLGYYLTYTQNLPLYWSSNFSPFSLYVEHFWTLANEEQFYLIWPLAVVMLGRRAVIPLGVGVAALSVVARAQGVHSWLLLARADGFAMGGLLAAMLADSERIAEQLVAYRRGLINITLVALAIVLVAMIRNSLPTFGRPTAEAAFSVLAINVVFAGLVGLVVTHAGRPAVAWLRRPRLVHIGKLSYGLYVYHYVVLTLGNDILLALFGQGRTSLTNGPLIVLTYVIAAASWKWFEKPLLDLKGQFEYGVLKTCEMPSAVPPHQLPTAHFRNEPHNARDPNRLNSESRG